MIRHIVLFRFKPGTTARDIAFLMTGLDGLLVEIPQILSFERGENFSHRADGHTHVATMTFADRASLAAFYDHSAHQQLITALIKPITANLLISDYEVEAAAKGAK